MIEKNFTDIFSKFELQFFRRIFNQMQDRDGSLTAMEAFALEVIRMLGSPTVGQFADFLKISQSNATYKVNSLIKKGYLERQNSSIDRREYHLVLSEKYYQLESLLTSYEHTVIDRIEDRIEPEDLVKFDEVLDIISRELMPECG